jgi:hypothetical protein
MALDPTLLDQVLNTPEEQDISASPIVRAVILPDPANAAALVPALEHGPGLRARNARRILGGFAAAAAPHLLAALTGAGARARREGIEALFGLLTTEEGWVVRSTLEASQQGVEALLQDRTPIPDDLPEYIERDFEGRICDLAFIAIQELLDPEYDQSLFRSFDDRDRDEEIRRLLSGGFGLRIG